MDLTWETEFFAPQASPSTLLDGVKLVPFVSDLLLAEEHTVEALVRTDPAHVVRLRRSRTSPRATCSCGASQPARPCVHALAAWTRDLQLREGLDDSRITRWEHLLESRKQLESVGEGFADRWLDIVRNGTPDEEGELLWTVPSLNGQWRIARALVGRATGKELSRFLLGLATSRGIDGTSRLSTPAMVDADELINRLWQPLDTHAPGAGAPTALAILGSMRRMMGERPTLSRYEWTLRSACSTIGQLVVAGHADPRQVAETVLRAELAPGDSAHPWIAIIFDHMGDGAPLVAREMQALLDREAGMQPAAPRCRLRAEIAVSQGAMDDLLQVLATWPEAPFGEFARRLPPRHTTMSIFEAARSTGRLRWAPGWPGHELASTSGKLIHHIHDTYPAHPMWGDIAIGDVVTALAGQGRTGAARDALRAHAEKYPCAAHRFEFLRIWEGARLGPAGVEEADALFGPDEEPLADVLTRISQMRENAFCLDTSVTHRGLGAVLIAAVLLEDIPDEGTSRYLDAPVWTESFLSIFPEAADDLEHLASLPEKDVSEYLDGAVLDADLALRGLRIARHLVSDAGVATVEDARAKSPSDLIEAIGCSKHGREITGALVSLFVSGRSSPGDDILRPTLEQAVGGSAAKDTKMIRRAFEAEPRGANLHSYYLGLVLEGRRRIG